MIALSCDSVESHIGWTEDIKKYSGGKFSYPIIDDTSRTLAVELGKCSLIWHETVLFHIRPSHPALPSSNGICVIWHLYYGIVCNSDKFGTIRHPPTAVKSKVLSFAFCIVETLLCGEV